MDITTFISILKSRLEDLSFSNEYIDALCSETLEYLESVPKDKLEGIITESYLSNIVENARISDSESLFLSNPHSDSKENNISTQNTTDDVILIPINLQTPSLTDEKPNIKLSSFSESSTMIPLTESSTKMPAGETRMPYSNVPKKSPRTGLTNQQGETRVNRSSDTRAMTGGGTKRMTDEGGTKPLIFGEKKSSAKMQTPHHSPIGGSIAEKDLYNDRPTTIFIVLLLLFSPTLLVISALALFTYALVILSLGLSIALASLLFVLLVFSGSVTFIISFTSSLSLFFSGKIFMSLSDLGLSFIILSLTVLLSTVLYKLCKKALPSLSAIIVNITKISIKSVTDFFAKCRKGCITL